MSYLLPGEYRTIDLREETIPDMGVAVYKVAAYKKDYPNIKSVILSRSQRDVLVHSDPTLLAGAQQLEQQFEKPISDLDFVMVIEGCRVEIE